MDELREEIKKECEKAFATRCLPKIDPEIRHVYVEEFHKLIAVNRFIQDVWPIFVLLDQMGEGTTVRRKPGPWKFKNGLNGRFNS